MSRVLINARTAHDAASTDAVEVALFVIEHPLLENPIRLSTDPTERLSLEPLSYGTRSNWMDANPSSDPYLFVLVSTDLPSDLEDVPAAATIVLSNVDNRLSETLRSFTDRPTISMAVVMAASPNDIEAEFRGMAIVGSTGNAGEFTIEMSRAPIEEESVPMDRFTKHRFPGLYR